MPRVIPAAGAVLERIIDTAYGASPEGLARSAFVRLQTAQSKIAWALKHQRRYALVEGVDVLASARIDELAGMLDQRPVRICGIGDVRADPDHAGGHHASLLIDRLLDDAARAGADMALLFQSAASGLSAPDGFETIPMLDVELAVAKSARHGAPMTLVRGGEDRDLAAIVAMGRVRGKTFRFRLDRDAEFVKYAITKKRLLAGLAPPGDRQLQFVIAEEGITAAAYLVISISGHTWTIEECGDRDVSGARVGALLQALIAREPMEEPPIVRAWLPSGFVPPQVTILSARRSADVMMVRRLDRSHGSAPLSSEEVLYWRSDIV